MLLNPIPWNSSSDAYLLRYTFFSIIVILASTFIVGTILTLKYNKHRKLMGKIFVIIGILELSSFIIPIIASATGHASYFLSIDNPFTSLSILGCTTLAGGVLSIKQVKQHWMFFPIISAIIVVIWTIGFFFIY